MDNNNNNNNNISIRRTWQKYKNDQRFERIHSWSVRTGMPILPILLLEYNTEKNCNRMPPECRFNLRVLLNSFINNPTSDDVSSRNSRSLLFLFLFLDLLFLGIIDLSPPLAAISLALTLSLRVCVCVCVCVQRRSTTTNKRKNKVEMLRVTR